MDNFAFGQDPAAGAGLRRTLSLRGEGEGEGHQQSCAGLIVGADRAVMKLNGPLGDRQTQSGPSGLSFPGLRGSVEGAEYMT